MSSTSVATLSQQFGSRSAFRDFHSLNDSKRWIKSVARASDRVSENWKKSHSVECRTIVVLNKFENTGRINRTLQSLFVFLTTGGKPRQLRVFFAIHARRIYNECPGCRIKCWICRIECREREITSTVWNRTSEGIKSSTGSVEVPNAKPVSELRISRYFRSPNLKWVPWVPNGTSEMSNRTSDVPNGERSMPEAWCD